MKKTVFTALLCAAAAAFADDEMSALLYNRATSESSSGVGLIQKTGEGAWTFSDSSMGSIYYDSDADSLKSVVASKTNITDFDYKFDFSLDRADATHDYYCLTSIGVDMAIVHHQRNHIATNKYYEGGAGVHPYTINYTWTLFDSDGTTVLTMGASTLTTGSTVIGDYGVTDNGSVYNADGITFRSASTGSSVLTLDNLVALGYGKTYTLALSLDSATGNYTIGTEYLNREKAGRDEFYTDYVAVGNVKLTAVPEPAPATLSLLPPAGLAARRRRH